MAVTFSCTKKEERFVVCFLGAEGMQNAVFHVGTVLFLVEMYMFG
jgi:hypothetical protein